MVDQSKGGTGAKKVTVNADELSKVGQMLVNAYYDLNTAYTKTLNLRITPGSTTEATALSKAFETQAGHIQDGVNKFASTIYETGENLIQLANTYRTAEDLNKDDALRLQDLVDSVGPYFQGVSKILPSPAGGLPDTAPPPPQPPK